MARPESVLAVASRRRARRKLGLPGWVRVRDVIVKVGVEVELV